MAIRPDPEGVEVVHLHAMTGGFIGKRVLEVGCGSGRLTWRYADEAASVLGLDHNAEEIAQADAAIPEHLRGRVEFKAVSILDFAPAHGTTFDIAIFSWSL